MTAQTARVPDQVIETIKEGNHFLLVGHQKPDGDAVGSVTAMALGLRALGKQADIFLDLPLEEKLRWMIENEDPDQVLSSAYDVIIYLDCSTADYAFTPKASISYGKTMVIDHHISNMGYCDVNFIEEVSATGELVFRVLTALGVAIDAEMADRIYSAVSTDTGQFSYSDLSPETFEIIGELYKIKNSYTDLSKKLHVYKSFEQTKMYGEACNSLKTYCNGRIAVTTLPYAKITAFGGLRNITADIANIGVNVRGVALGINFKEFIPGSYRVSLRVNEPWPIDISVPALAHGGGGHSKAAGLTYVGKPENFIREMIAFFEESIEDKNDD